MTKKILSGKKSGGPAPLLPEAPVLSIVMGSQSDWETMKAAAALLREFSVPHECRIISAHRTPLDMVSYAEHAAGRGLRVIIAGAGGAAHLPGMLAALTPLPVLGVPVPSLHLNGMDSLLSIVQMPKGIPVATFAIGVPGATNAALFALSVLAGNNPVLFQKLLDYRQGLTEKVRAMSLPDSP